MIDGTSVSYQASSKDGNSTYSPLKITKDSSKKEALTWYFNDDQKDVAVINKHREADPIFIDSDKEIQDAILNNSAALPETIKVDRKNNRISYTLKNDNDEVKHLVKGAYLTYDDKKDEIIYTSPYDDKLSLTKVAD